MLTWWHCLDPGVEGRFLQPLGLTQWGQEACFTEVSVLKTGGGYVPHRDHRDPVLTQMSDG